MITAINNKRDILLPAVLIQAMTFIDEASTGRNAASSKEITALYNDTCDRQNVLSADAYSLARTMAIGALAEQEGSNIQASAAIASLIELLDTAAEGGEDR